jgi:hypothetical protein
MAVNKLAEALLVPFDDSQISERHQNPKDTSTPIFSYVDPAHYRRRLLETFTKGFLLHVEDAKLEAPGVVAQAHFIGEQDGVKYDIKMPVFEEYTISTTTNKAIQIAQTFSKLGSAGAKAVSRELGLGLHLYDKVTRKVSGGSNASTSAAGTSSAAPDAQWDGSAKVTFGAKYKGMAYKDIEDGWITWAATKDKPDQGAVKELARRKAVASGTTTTSSNQEPGTVTNPDDGAFPF